VIARLRDLRARDLLAPQVILLAAIVAVMAVTFAVIIATLDRGFDWSDEAFVDAMIVSDRASSTEFFGFQHLLNPVYELLGGSVLALRILRLLGYVALGVALTFIARAVLRMIDIQLGRIAWLLIGLVAQVGTLAAWSYPPRSLGYNELSSWLTQIGAALLFYALLEGRFARDDRQGRRWAIWLTTGTILSALLVAKVTAGVFLSLVAVVVALVAIGGVRWKRVAGLLGGFAIGLVLMAAAGVPLLSYVATTARLVADPSAQAESGYSITTLLLTYLASMALTVSTLAVPILFAAILMIVVRGLRVDSAPARRVVASAENVALFLAFVLAVVLASIYVFPSVGGDLFPSVLDSWQSLGVTNAFLLAVALLAFAVLAPAGQRSPADQPTDPIVPKRGNLVVGLAFGLFALTPLISALGTNNQIFGHTVYSATTWAVGAAVGLVLLWRRSGAGSAAVRLIPLFLIGVIVASSGLAVAGDVFLHPYRTVGYFTQKATIEVGALHGIRVTEGEAELYTWLHDAGVREEAHDVPTLSIASPGALLAFNASGWSAIWPGRAWASSIAQSCADDEPDDLFVLQAASEVPGSSAHDRLVAGLEACGIDFPADFELVDRHSSDEPVQDVSVWRLR
jgi:hypothetical protein